MVGSRRRLGLGRKIIFSLIPACFLLLVGEVGIRILGVTIPSVHSMPLPEELFGVMQADTDLMWSLEPNEDVRIRTPYRREPLRIRTNSVGLRGEEIAAKASGEFRILSLGESSTFGAFVDDDATYSAKLEKRLNEMNSSRRYRVINAGVSAYSSYQSLLYLRLRGVKLKPDMVLFYHEFNDYLPSSLRSSNNTAFGLARTDMQLHESSQGWLSRHLMAHSAMLRFLSQEWNRYHLSQFTRSVEPEAARSIGLPSLRALPRVVEDSNGKPAPYEIKHDALPRRVSESERREILDQLCVLCEQQGIRLVIIHPSYRFSQRHSCVLTDFCRRTGVAMFEAQDVLHPSDESPDKVFLDAVHPSPRGHELLAEGLSHFVLALHERQQH